MTRPANATSTEAEFSLPADVADMIRAVRSAAGLTQVQLAQRAETTQSMVARYESGAVSPTVRALARIVAACGQTLVLTTAQSPDRAFGEREHRPAGSSDYLNRPDSGWVPGPTPRRRKGEQEAPQQGSAITDPVPGTAGPGALGPGGTPG